MAPMSMFDSSLRRRAQMRRRANREPAAARGEAGRQLHQAGHQPAARRHQFSSSSGQNVLLSCVPNHLVCSLCGPLKFN